MRRSTRVKQLRAPRTAFGNLVTRPYHHSGRRAPLSMAASICRWPPINVADMQL